MSDETEREGRCIDCLYSALGWCKDSCACDCHPANAETRTTFSDDEWAKAYRRQGAEVASLQEEVDRLEAERDEALGLLRELVGLEEECSPSHGDYPRLYESAWARARALVERAGPAGAHPAEEAP